MADEEKTEAAPAADEGPKLTAREIDKLNVPKLKEAALAYKGRISGVHGMDKAQLARALKEINGIPLQEPKRASKIDRTAVKQKIKTLKKESAQHAQTKNGLQPGRARR